MKDSCFDRCPNYDPYYGECRGTGLGEAPDCSINLHHLSQLVDVDTLYEVNSKEGKSKAYDKWAKGSGFSWGEYEAFWSCWQAAQKDLLKKAIKLKTKQMNIRK